MLELRPSGPFDHPVVSMHPCSRRVQAGPGHATARGEEPVMTFKPNLIVLAMAAAGMFVAGQVSAAALPVGSSGQDASAPRTDNGKSDSESKRKQDMEDQLATQLNTITVTGFSRSIATSIDYQRYSDKIENVVTAADIGGLPDQSIADALTRLPGVA